MAGLDGAGIGHKLVMQTLENGLVVILFLVLHQTDAVIGIEPSGIELIERKPEVHDIAQTLE